MSLHADMTGCEHTDRDGKREVFWRARCECGWAGEAHSTSALSEAAKVAKLNYRAHVEEALGAQAYYSAPVACKNCGSEHEQGVLIGTHVTSERCTRCGTTMLTPSNDAWNESRENSKRWSW